MNRSGSSSNRARVLLLAAAAALIPITAIGGKPAKNAKTAKKKVEAPKLDLNLGALSKTELPRADGLTTNRAAQDALSPKVTAPKDVSYQVLTVQHAYDFSRGMDGTKPVGDELKEIGLYGQPPSTPKFSTLVRVKASKPVNTSTSIELVILDPRGDTALSGNGELSFRGSKNGEAEWVIDWAPTARASGGMYQLLVRIAGQPMGTWPLKVVAETK